MYSKQHQEIDSQYQEKIENQRTFEVDNKTGNKPTYYVLDMFAYPSGVGLHLGHALTYTATDIRARSMRLLGYEVLYPVGFDSFGLPTENFAMKVGKSAQKVTKENTDNFREQLKKLAISYDWSREIITSDKDYYKWTQWLVLKLWEHGLLYKKLAPVNWCPNCQTVLANEQVVHGKCERDDTPVEQRQMEQWFVNITKYADELVDGLDILDWPEESKKMQKNWIGRREGFEFSLTNNDGIDIGVFVEKNKFNTNIDGVAISINHPMVPQLIGNNGDMREKFEEYSQDIKMMGAIDKYERYPVRTGIFSGVYLNSTFNNQKIPLFISGNVSNDSDAEILYHHSEKRDKAIFDESNIKVDDSSSATTETEQPLHELESLESTGKIKSGKRYRLRDWSISRQRYWGAPMPFLYSSDGTIRGVNEGDLPVLLPENVQNYKPSGISPLGQVSEFVNSIGENGVKFKREVDTLDTFVDSAFYYLRYLSPKDSDNFISPEALEKWGDVDMYIGGKEHVTAHLIYARFIHKFLRDAGIVKSSEPFPSLRHQGVVLDSNGIKMSKRLGNVVNPIDVIDKYGADTLRVYLMFMGPLSDPHMWDENGIEGVAKFLDKVSKLGNFTQDRSPTQEELNITNKLIQEVKSDTLALKYNTAVSKFMVFVNGRLSAGEISKSTFKALLILLNPYAPNFTDFLWREQGFTTDIDRAEFPTLTETGDDSEQLCNLVVQINGKTRGVINNTLVAISEEDALSMVKTDDRFSKYIGDQIIKNIIYRAGKIINIVI